MPDRDDTRTLTDGPIKPNPAADPAADPAAAVTPPSGPATERMAEGPWPEVPGYEIDGELGRGGMGVVYRARQYGLNRTVALKMVLAGTHARAEDLVRFLTEAETAAKLHHHGIAQIYGSGRAGGLPFFVMECVDGGSLADKLLAGPLPPADAARLARRLAEAVAHAHAVGVVHRDLKPSNVLLTADGSPKITDFGLARRLEGGDGLTRTGAVSGTPSYMPPEQARGDLKAVGPAGDVYALGAVLYQCLTGKPPFLGANPAATLTRVLKTPPARPRSVNPAVPRDLETVALKCLEKDPARRYSSAEALAADLDRYLQGRPVAARRVGAVGQTWRWAKRNPAVAGLLAAVFASLAAGAATATAFAVRADHNADRAAREAVRADGHAAEARRRADEAVAARLAVDRTLSDSYATLGQTAGERNDPAVAALWFAQAVTHAAGDPDRDRMNRLRFRNWAALAFAPAAAVPTESVLQPAFHPGGRYLRARHFTGHEEVWDLTREAAWPRPPDHAGRRLTAAAWNPAGTRIALASDGGPVGVYEFPAGSPVQVWAGDGPTARLAFSPDGRRVAVAGKATRVWDFAADAFVTPEWELPAPPRAVGFSPDGTKLVVVGTKAATRVYDLTGEPGPEPAAEVPDVSDLSPRFVDGGAVLLTVPKLGFVAGVAPATGAEVFRIPADSYRPCLAVAPDGTSFWVPRHTAAVRYTAAGRPAGGRVMTRDAVADVAVGPDGAGVLTAGTDRFVRVSAAADGAPLHPPLSLGTPAAGVGWSADGRRIAATVLNNLARVWNLPASPPVRVIEPPTAAGGAGDSVCAARFGASGRFVLPVGGTNMRPDRPQLRLYDPATGAPAGPVFDPGGLLLDADLSPDGRWLLTAASPFPPGQGLREQKMHGRGAGVLRVWETATGRPAGEPIDTPSEPRSVRFSPDGTRAAVLCSGGHLLTLDPAAAAVVRTDRPAEMAHPAGDYLNNGMVRYSGDGRRVYAFAPREGFGLRAVDAATGRTLYAVGQAAELWDVCESPDEAVLAVANGGAGVIVVDARTGTVVAPRLPHPDRAFACRFDRTGTRLVTACRDQSVRVWDWRAGTVRAVAAHEDEAFAADFTPDGRFVVSVGHDGTARMWDAATGRPVAPPVPLGGKGLTLDLTPDGRYAVAGGFARRLTVLDLHALTRPAEGSAADLVRWAELVSGQRIDANSGPVHLTADEWLARWRKHRAGN